MPRPDGTILLRAADAVAVLSQQLLEPGDRFSIMHDTLL